MNDYSPTGVAYTIFKLPITCEQILKTIQQGRVQCAWYYLLTIFGKFVNKIIENTNDGYYIKQLIVYIYIYHGGSDALGGGLGVIAPQTLKLAPAQ